MRFEEAYEGWNAGRLTQGDAARLLGMCERSFRRYLARYEAEGLDGLIDRRLEQMSNRRAPVDEVMALTDRYQDRDESKPDFDHSQRKPNSSEARFLGWCFRSHRGSLLV